MAGRPTRLTIAKRDILAHFDNLESRLIFRYQDIANVLSGNREFWRLAKNTTVKGFIAFLLKEGRLQHHILAAENYDQEHHRYTWGDDPTFVELVLSLKKSSYITHGSAAAFHGLNDLILRTVYVNQEQSPKVKNKGLILQANIDRAFSRKQRVSNFTISNPGTPQTALIVNGKNTRLLGVEKFTSSRGEKILITDLERTLIDIVVRPIYSGGISEIIESYTRAKESISTNILRSYLKQLDYSYPYHQAIGWYMEKAGYEKSRLSLMRELGLEFNFYLTYGMENTQFDETWKLHIPRGF